MAVFQYKIIIFHGKFSILSEFPTEKVEKKKAAFRLQFAVLPQIRVRPGEVRSSGLVVEDCRWFQQQPSHLSVAKVRRTVQRRLGRPAKCIISNTQFLVFDTQFLVFNAKFIIFTNSQPPIPMTRTLQPTAGATWPHQSLRNEIWNQVEVMGLFVLSPVGLGAQWGPLSILWPLES